MCQPLTPVTRLYASLAYNMRQYEYTRGKSRLLTSKMGHILAIFVYEASSELPQLELKRFSMLRRSLLKMVTRLSKGEPS